MLCSLCSLCLWRIVTELRIVGTTNNCTLHLATAAVSCTPGLANLLGAQAALAPLGEELLVGRALSATADLASLTSALATLADSLASLLASTSLAVLASGSLESAELALHLLHERGKARKTALATDTASLAALLALALAALLAATSAALNARLSNFKVLLELILEVFDLHRHGSRSLFWIERKKSCFHFTLRSDQGRFVRE